MATTSTRKIFVNLPVRDLKKSMSFFSTLGFAFNSAVHRREGRLHGHQRARRSSCSSPSRIFRTFTKQALCDTSKATEGLFALSCESRREVDEIVEEGYRRRRPPCAWMRRITASCTAGASTISTATIGNCSGWISAGVTAL